MTDRETLEAEALEAVCACMYYDLADYLDSSRMKSYVRSLSTR